MREQGRHNSARPARILVVVLMILVTSVFVFLITPSNYVITHVGKLDKFVHRQSSSLVKQSITYVDKTKHVTTRNIVEPNSDHSSSHSVSSTLTRAINGNISNTSEISKSTRNPKQSCNGCKTIPVQQKSNSESTIQISDEERVTPDTNEAVIQTTHNNVNETISLRGDTVSENLYEESDENENATSMGRKTIQNPVLESRPIANKTTEILHNKEGNGRQTTLTSTEHNVSTDALLTEVASVNTTNKLYDDNEAENQTTSTLTEHNVTTTQNSTESLRDDMNDTNDISNGEKDYKIPTKSMIKPAFVRIYEENEYYDKYGLWKNKGDNGSSEDKLMNVILESLATHNKRTDKDDTKDDVIWPTALLS